MKTRNTVLLFLVAAGLFAFVQCYERDRPGTRGREEAARHVFTFNRDDVQKIVLRREGEETVLERDGVRWCLSAPVADRADSGAIAELFTAAETMTREAAIELPEKKDDRAQAKLKEFGLAKSDLRVRFEGPKARPELMIGKETAIEGRIYVRFSDNNTVFVAPDTIKTLALKSADAWRDRSIFDLGTQRPERIAVRSPRGEIVVDREGGDWVLTKPFRARADNDRMAAMLKELRAMRIEGFLADQEVGEIKGRLVLRMAGSQDERRVLEIGEGDVARPGLVRVRISGREGAMLLPATIATLVERTPNDFRDRKVARFEMAIVDRIAVEVAGVGRTVIGRDGEGWVSEPDGAKVPVPLTAVDELVAVLREGCASRFISDVPAQDDRYGFSRPSAMVSLSSYASENTAESAKGERPFCTVVIGAPDGEERFLKLEEEPFVVTVEATWAERLRAAATALIGR